MAAIETLRPSHPRRPRWTWPRLRGFGANAILLLLALAMLLPIVWLFIQSILGNGSALRLPPVWLPTHPTLANYHQVFGFIPFLTFLWNSVKITAIVTVGAVTTSALAAYAFARLSFPFRNTLFVILLCAIMVPNQVTAAPTYVLMHQLGLAQSQAAVWLPGLVSVFGIFLLRQFFQGIPRDLEEAARLDGLSTLGILFRIVLPLSPPRPRGPRDPDRRRDVERLLLAQHLPDGSERYDASRRPDHPVRALSPGVAGRHIRCDLDDSRAALPRVPVRAARDDGEPDHDWLQMSPGLRFPAPAKPHRTAKRKERA